MRSLLEQPWWRRTWILQEVMMANTLVVSCRRHRVRWISLVENWDTALAINHASYGAAIPSSMDSNIAALLLGFRQEVRISHKATSFLDMLQMFRHCGATDPRDKVFALVGIAEVWCGEVFEIDYCMPLEQVYRKIVAHIIDTSQNLDILAWAWPPGQRRQDLPSWAPDWSVSVFDHQSMLHSWHIGQQEDPLYLVGGSPKSKPIYEFSSDLSQLTLRGARFDEKYSLSVAMYKIIGNMPESIRRYRDALVSLNTDPKDLWGSVAELTECSLRALTADAQPSDRLTPEYMKAIIT